MLRLVWPCDGIVQNYADSDISTACHPPSLYEEYLTSIQTSRMVGKDQEAAPKPDGLIQSNTTSTQLASTPSMLPRWSMTDPNGRSFFADCQRSNPSMALKSSKSSTKLNLIGSLGHHQNMFFQSFSHDNNNNNIQHDNQHCAYFGIQNDKLNF